MKKQQNCPKISVIIPTYNSENYIIETLESVLNQSYSNIEIIIVDDGSNDSTKELLRPYSDRIIYQEIPHSGLPAVARNRGIRISTGKYIAFLDSDDIWIPEKLDRQHSIFINNPNVGLISTNAIKFKDRIDDGMFINRHEELFHLSQEKSGVRRYVDILHNNHIITSSTLMKRECFNQNELFSELYKFRAVEDYHLWLRIAFITDIYFLNEPLLRYRDRIDSIRSEESTISYYKKIFWVYSDLVKKMKQNHKKKTYILATYREQLFIIIESCKFLIRTRRISYLPSFLLDAFLSKEREM